MYTSEFKIRVGSFIVTIVLELYYSYTEVIVYEVFLFIGAFENALSASLLFTTSQSHSVPS